ncbi:MAG TPA: uracil-DNA glycosylase [Nannocystis exedens]|nr:uracil-DNA glycosylase [Nannocystis exedens]
MPAWPVSRLSAEQVSPAASAASQSRAEQGRVEAPQSERRAEQESPQKQQGDRRREQESQQSDRRREQEPRQSERRRGQEVQPPSPLRAVVRGLEVPSELKPAGPNAGRSVESRAKVTKASEWSAAKKLDYLRTRNIGDCRRCALAAGRTHIVFGVGNPEADLMFVGEAPGYNEDRQGIPFVGRAGERLNLWLDMLGVPRDNAYIANVLKCRPPQNRDPRPEEVERCSAFLHAQIRAIRPKVLIALGRFAGNLLTGSQSLPLWKMRGQVLTYREAKHGTTVPTIVTYHPSYVLRQSGAQAAGKSKEDLSVLGDLRRAVEILRASPT